MEEHSRVLDRFPELRTQLETRARTQRSANLAEERRAGVVAVPSQFFYDDVDEGRHKVRWAFCKDQDVIDIPA